MRSLTMNISKKPQQLGVTQSEIVALMDNFNEYQGTTAIACAMSEVLDNQFNTADNTNDIMIGIIDLIIFFYNFEIVDFNHVLVISDLLAFDLTGVNAVATDAGNRMFYYIVFNNLFVVQYQNFRKC